LAEVLRAAGCSSSSNSDDLFWRAAGVGGGDSPKSDMLGYAARVRDQGSTREKTDSNGRAETRQDRQRQCRTPGPPSSAPSGELARRSRRPCSETSLPPPSNAKLQPSTHTEELSFTAKSPSTDMVKIQNDHVRGRREASKKTYLLEV
jgi:hypothetical protein